MKKSKRKKAGMSSKYITFALIVMLALGGSAYFIHNILQEDAPVNKVEIAKEIKDWGYTLDDRDSELMKTYFNELNDVLTKEEVDYETYAKILSKLYIVDLYTLNNKINASDMPCLEYIYPGTETSFKNNLFSTMYRSIEDNKDKKRKQKLPIVLDVEVLGSKEVETKVKDKELSGYEVSLKWTYQEDLGYDQEAIITVVKLDKKLYVAIQKVD